MSKPDYDTTLARIAGNIASGLLASGNGGSRALIVEESIGIALAIVAAARQIAREIQPTASGGPK